MFIIIGLTARRGGERKGKEEVESEYVWGGRADPVPRESLEKKWREIVEVKAGHVYSNAAAGVRGYRRGRVVVDA